MELCGGQTNTYLENSISDFLPSRLNIVHGPGCAMCAAPVSLIDSAVQLAQQESVVLCASGDLLRLKGSSCDLLEIKARGHDVRVVHTPLDSLAIARETPHKKVVFLSIGFEMTAQSNALAIWQAKRLGLRNYLLLASQGHVPAVVKRLLKEPGTRVQGIFGLSDICSVAGWSGFEQLSKRFRVPMVVTGHEPLDLLEGIRIVVDLLESNSAVVENQCRGGVSRDGNREAKALIKEVFELADRYWRGIGKVENGGYRLKPEFQAHDAEQAFGLKILPGDDSPLCISRDILFGFKKPPDCPAFGKTCRPGSALGATMVASEGVCASYYRYHADR